MNIKSTTNKAIAPYQMRRSLGQADIVIVGNGIAGLTAALEARRLAPDKSIVIITDQIHPTINTPALKQFAIAKLAREQLLAYPAGTERAERIHVVNTRVEEIHARSKYVTLQGGQGFGYGSLLLSTGSKPMGLSNKIPGYNFDGVLTLHRLQDYLDLRRRIGEVSEVVVVGGGVHAIETVMGMLYWGLRTHWLIRGKTFMRNMLDKEASDLVLNSMRRMGAEVHLETEISGVMGRVGSVAGVITNHSEMIPCQMILSCTGTKPVLSLAENCSVPLMIQNGIMVDDKLRTSVRDIYAAGDVAALKNPQTGVFEPRALWFAAAGQARIAGAMLAGASDIQHEPFGVPWHATHLGELSMLTVGDPLSKDPQMEVLTDIGKGEYRRVTLDGDRLVGYLSLGATPPDSLAIKRIIDEGISVRDVIKPLLKGQFDARSYLSGQRSRATRNLLTGKVPALQLPAPAQQPQRGTSTRQLEPSINEMYPRTSKQSTDPLRLRANGSEPTEYRQQEALRLRPSQPVAPEYRQADRRRMRSNESERPITGPLSSPSQQPQISLPEIVEDDINPFTGNLPAINYNEPPARAYSYVQNDREYEMDDMVASRVVPDKKPMHYKLWAYMDRSSAEGFDERPIYTQQGVLND